MKVLVVNETSSLGGAETMALELVNALSAMPACQAAFASPAGVLSSRLEDKVKYFRTTSYSPLSIPKIIYEFRAIYREVKPDIIHSQGATIGVLASIAARLFSRRSKVVVTHHSVGFTRVHAVIANVLLKRLMDACIAISKAKYSTMVRDGFDPARTFLIPNFVNREALVAAAASEHVRVVRAAIQDSADQRVVVCAGRLMREKRFDLFVETLAECARKRPSIKILGIILGDGTEKQRLQGLIDDNKLTNLKIRLEGFQQNVAGYLKMADVFLFPSEWKEVLPMCLIEASALGVPIVCSDIPGNYDIVEDGVNGFLVDGRKRDYHVYVLRLLQDEALRQELSANGIKRAQELYGKNKVVADIVNVYRTTLGS